MKQSVMIIDDKRGFADPLAKAFSREGWEAQAAYSIKQSLSVPKREFIPNVILLDINLPGEHGVDFVPDFIQKYPEACLMMMTCEDRNMEYVRLSMKNGAHDFLTKPMRNAAIVERCQIELGKWRSVRAEIKMKTIVQALGAQSHGLKNDIYVLSAEISDWMPEDRQPLCKKLLKKINVRLNRYRKIARAQEMPSNPENIGDILTLAAGEAAEEYDILNRNSIRPDIEFDYPNQGCQVNVNQELMSEVLQILFMNAFEDSRGQSDPSTAVPVKVKISAENDYSTITITNVGSQFPDEVLYRNRHQPYTSRPGSGGQGIGLLLATDVIESYNGELELKNLKSENAAQVTVRLPTYEPETT